MNRRWLTRRLISVAVVVFLVCVAAYGLIDALPGSTATTVIGPDATPEQIAIVERDLNLDKPFPVRFGLWLSRAAQGDLGVSYQTGEVISVALRQRVPTSLELLALTQLTAIAIAVPAAVFAARRENGRADRALSSGSFLALALPQFAFGIVLLTVFAQKLRWFPVADYKAFGDDPIGNLEAMALPVTALALPLSGIYFRVLRTDLVQTLRADHITFARAMGLRSRRIVWGRALRPSGLALLSVIGINTAYLLGSAVVAENLFSIPGLGRFVLEGVQTRDAVKVQGGVLVIALVYVVVNLLVDVVLSILDPRIRLEGRAA